MASFTDDTTTETTDTGDTTTDTVTDSTEDESLFDRMVRVAGDIATVIQPFAILLTAVVNLFAVSKVVTL